MPQFGKKKSYTDWLYTRPVLFFLAGLIIFLGTAVFERFWVERDMYARQVAAEAALQSAKDHKADLEKQVQYLEGERGMEEEVRKHFDVAREGETVVILMGDDEEESTTAPAEETPQPKWYQFWR